MINEIHNDANDRMNKTLASLEVTLVKFELVEHTLHYLNKFTLNIMAP